MSVLSAPDDKGRAAVGADPRSVPPGLPGMPIRLSSKAAIDALIGQTAVLLSPQDVYHRRHRWHGRSVRLMRREGRLLIIERGGEKSGLPWQRMSRLAVQLVTDGTEAQP